MVSLTLLVTLHAAVTKMPDQSDLREGGFVLDSISKEKQPILVGKTWCLQCKDHRHIAPVVRKQGVNSKWGQATDAQC